VGRTAPATGDYLLLEGEGGKIGRIFLPATVADAIRSGLPVLITASVSARPGGSFTSTLRAVGMRPIGGVSCTA